MNYDARFMDKAEIEEGLERIRARFAPGWGAFIYTGRGWFPLLIELDEVLSHIDSDYKSCQIKEKYGTLRWYLGADRALHPACCELLLDADLSDEEWAAHEETADHLAHHDRFAEAAKRWLSKRDLMEKVISRYEQISALTCEECGGPGELKVHGGWWKTTCAAHDPDAKEKVVTTYEVANGTLRNVHLAGTCAGEYCCVHNPSDHHMVTWPQHWDSAQRVMMRECPHGQLHFDPNDPKAATRAALGHECDGCCTAPLR